MTKSFLKFYLALTFYFMLVCLWSRAFFILSQWNRFPQLHKVGVFKSFLYGSRIDFSLVSYVMVLPLLFCLLKKISDHNRPWLNLIKYWTLGITGVMIIISIVDAIVYKHWSVKFNLMALSFAKYPGEVMASIGSQDHVFLYSWIGIITFFLLWRICKYLFVSMKDPNASGVKQKLVASMVFLILITLSILGIRGGTQLEPINQSAAFYSGEEIYNHTALNSAWNLMYVIINHRGNKNPYHMGREDEVQEALQQFYPRTKDSTHLVKIDKPNIVILVLEGFTADVISAFGGESGLTPTLDSLVGESIIFTRFYANGDRTYKGLPAILNGCPTQPVGSIVQYPDKTKFLPSISKSIKTRGYTSSFYYGGESEFANIKSYLLQTGFDHIVDEKDFPSEYRGKKWGVPDHHVLDKAAKDYDQSPQPFFSTLLTLSTHEPYDIPMEPKIKSNSEADLYRNTVYYTDHSLGKFINESKSKPWYKNTLFVLTADHGNGWPKNYKNNYEPGRFHIPLMVFGDVLVDSLKGRKMDRVGSQTDLANTLLVSLKIDASEYKFSRNLLDDTNAHDVFYTFDHGFGMIGDDDLLVYNLNSDSKLLENGNINDQSILKGKLIMQGTYDPYKLNAKFR